MRRWQRVLGVLLVGSIGLVGFGGDGDDETTTPATVDSNTDGAGGDTDGSPGGTGSINSAACLQAATAMATAAGGLSTAFSGESDDLEDSVEAFEAFADAAPSEIRDDLQTVAEGYAEFIEVLAEANFNPTSGEVPSPETMAQLEAASEKLENSDFEAAAARVETWFDTECGED